MAHDIREGPKRLSPWAPFAVPAKIQEWLDEHRRTDRLDRDDDRGGYVHRTRAGKGALAAWADVAHYDTQVDFALAQGIISAREAREARDG